MPTLTDRHIVDATWLASRNGADDLVVLDASLHLPSTGRSASAEFADAHIIGAAFFDIAAIADHTTALPNMLPTAEAFAEAVGALGISSDTAVVVYDTVGLYSAARAWWMFRAMGHDNVAVLDGGLPKWVAEGRPTADATTTSDQEASPKAGAPFNAETRPALVRSLREVASASGIEQIVDARAAERFVGTSPEPRDGLRSGHIPGARNVPFGQLLAADGTLLSPDELRAVFVALGVDPDRPVIASCGSGVTAGVIALALAVLGNDGAAVYDGSWTEWGDESSGTEVETGTVAP